LPEEVPNGRRHFDSETLRFGEPVSQVGVPWKWFVDEANRDLWEAFQMKATYLSFVHKHIPA
jgi:hypothetical protein